MSDERDHSCAALLARAGEFFARHGIKIQRVMTDNALASRQSHAFRAALEAFGARHLLTRSHRPQTNGKVERFTATLVEEWAYVRAYNGNQERVDLLQEWLHLYNHHRAHTSLGGLRPISRVNDLCGNYT